MAYATDNLLSALQRVATLIKGQKLATGDLTALLTTVKTDVVSAINELHGQIGSGGGGGGASIDDTAGSGATNVTWSADKIGTAISDAIQALVNGAPAALDTIAEIAAMFNNDANYATAVATAISNRVRFDAAQALTAAQKLQACQNLGIGDPATDFVAAFEAALL